MTLLPSNFDDLIQSAVKVFWESRATGSNSQADTRGNVISGKNLDGFFEVVKVVAKHCNFPEESIFVNRGKIALPGYFRPTKQWDVVFVFRRRVIATLELKSQVGSFGNNCNNRSEEAIGSGVDFFKAAERGAFAPRNHVEFDQNEPAHDDPRPPFLGYLMLLEKSLASTSPVGVVTPHFQVFPDFVQASYADRYRILFERMMAENIYDAASLILSPQTDRSNAIVEELSPATSPKNLFAQLAGRLAAALES